MNRYPYIPGDALAREYRTSQTAESKTIWYAIGRLEQYQAVLETPSETDCEQELEDLEALIVDLKAIGKRCMAHESNAWEVYTLVDKWQARNRVTPNAINAFVAETLQAAQDVLVQKVGEATNG